MKVQINDIINPLNLPVQNIVQSLTDKLEYVNT